MSESSYIDVLATQTEKILIDGNNINDYFIINENVNHPNLPNDLPSGCYFQYESNNQQFVYCTNGSTEFFGQFFLMPLVDINSLSFDYYVDEYNYLSIYDTTGAQYLEEINSTGSIKCSLRAGECLIIQLDYDYYFPTNTEVSAYISNITIDIEEKTNAANKLAYIGVPTEVPVYEITEESVKVVGSNIDSFFSVNDISIEDINQDNELITYDISTESFSVISSGEWDVHILALRAIVDIQSFSFDYYVYYNEGTGPSLSIYNQDNIIYCEIINVNENNYGTVECSLSAGDYVIIQYDGGRRFNGSMLGLEINNLSIHSESKIQIDTEIKEVARNVSDIYIGVPTEVIIYDENSGNVSLTSENIETYFDVTFEGEGNTFQWIDDALVSDFENPVEPSTYSDIQTFAIRVQYYSRLRLIAKKQIQFAFNVDFDNELSTFVDEPEGPLEIYINEAEPIGIQSNQSLSYTLNEGDNIVIVHDPPYGKPYVSLSNLKILRDKEIIDTYIESRGRRIIKAYVGVNGIAKQFYQKIKCNIPFVDGTVAYTGSTVSPIWNNYDNTKMDISGDISAIEVGKYTTIFTLKQGYFWTDGTTAPKYINWEIALLLSDLLIDFYYEEKNGVATITGWKKTYKGEQSTEIIIPDNHMIIL